MTILEMTRMMSYGLLIGSSGLLVLYLGLYARTLLANPYRHGWSFIGLSAGAGVLYGGLGIVYEMVGSGYYRIFRDGASLFFILFLALGMRVIAHSNNDHDNVDPWPNYIITLLVVGAWWIAFYFNPDHFVRSVELAGWTAATLWAIGTGNGVVRQFEGTGIAAVVRHLLPAAVCFGGIVVTEILLAYTGRYQNLSDAVWIVGIILVSAFLFNTAVTIHQQRAELKRIYDRTRYPGPDS